MRHAGPPTGDDVTILGTEDEYFKIKPPEGSYLYVDKTFVDPVQVVPEPGRDPVPMNPVPTLRSIQFHEGARCIDGK